MALDKLWRPEQAETASGKHTLPQSCPHLDLLQASLVLLGLLSLSLQLSNLARGARQPGLGSCHPGLCSSLLLLGLILQPLLQLLQPLSALLLCLLCGCLVLGEHILHRHALARLVMHSGVNACQAALTEVLTDSAWAGGAGRQRNHKLVLPCSR